MSFKSRCEQVNNVLPCEVSRVHAIVEDVDSSDLTQTQVAERHQEAVPENNTIRDGQVSATWRLQRPSHGPPQTSSDVNVSYLCMCSTPVRIMMP